MDSKLRHVERDENELKKKEHELENKEMSLEQNQPMGWSMPNIGMNNFGNPFSDPMESVRIHMVPLMPHF